MPRHESSIWFGASIRVIHSVVVTAANVHYSAIL